LVGRIDDMFIVRGENIYPSAIEDVLRAVEGFGGEFRVIVSRAQAMDELLVRAEYDKSVSDLPAFEKILRERLQARLGVRPRIELVSQGAIPRTEFKARRVIDDRDLYGKGTGHGQ
jgi:phenylacetate-CoA ligase